MSHRSRCGPRLAQLINGVLCANQCQQLLNLIFYDPIRSLNNFGQPAVIWVQSNCL